MSNRQYFNLTQHSSRYIPQKKELFNHSLYTNMMYRTDMPYTKWTFVTANLIVALSLLGYSIFRIVMYFNQGGEFSFDKFDVIGMTVMISGIVIFIIAFLGLWAAFARRSWLILIYSILLGSAIALIFFGLFATLSMKQVSIDDLWSKAFDYSLKKFTLYEDSWDFFQTKLDCCGVDGPDDWTKVLNADPLPSSCCKGLNSDVCSADLASKIGCKQALNTFFDSYRWIFVLLATTLVFIQIMLFGMSCSLYGAFLRDEKDKLFNGV